MQAYMQAVNHKNTHKDVPYTQHFRIDSLDAQWSIFSFPFPTLSNTLCLLRRRSTSEESTPDPWPSLSPCIHTPSPPPIMPGQCMMWGRNRVGGTMGCVACNYRSLAVPVAVMCNSQIKVQPEDSAGLTAALCFLIAGSWVSHVKWQAGKCEIPDKAQSPKKPWSSSNEESDVVWGLVMLSRQVAANVYSFCFSLSSWCACLCEKGREVEVFVYLTLLIQD